VEAPERRVAGLLRDLALHGGRLPEGGARDDRGQWHLCFMTDREVGERAGAFLD
jgi:hypothetical protein